MRAVVTKVYKFEELSDSAKERARDWFREIDDFLETVDYNDFEQVAKILGVTFETRNKTTPAIYWALHGQGQYCAFEGRYDYNKNAPALIREYAPQDGILHDIADNLEDLQQAHNNQVSARMNCDRDYLTVETFLDGDSAPIEIADAVKEVMRDFCRWMLNSLLAEWEHTQTNEYIDENIIANQYEFFASGKRYIPER